MAPAASALQDLSGRDWASLTSGPAGLIAERALSNDVADYVRFRAACTAWRACCPDPRAHGVFDRRFHPRQWITLPGALNAHRPRRFLNVFTGERIHVPLPDLAHCLVFGRSAEGLLVLCRTDTYAVQLLNPLTRQIANLPSATTLFGSRVGMWRLDHMLREERKRMNGAGLVDDSTVVLLFRSYAIAIAKPGDKRWTRFQNNILISSSLAFAGRFYCATSVGISVLDTTAHQRPKLVAAAGYHPESCLVGPVWLVDIDGELAYCAWSLVEGYVRCKAWRVQLDTRNAVPMPGLKGRTLLIGEARSLVVSAKLSQSISNDTIYVCSSSDGKNGCQSIVAYDFSGRISTESIHFNDDMVEYLSCYVLKSQNVMRSLRKL